MSKHTPGPWEYDKSQPDHGWTIKQKGTNPGTGDPEGVVGCSEWIWIEDANGYLMAAAPDLLEACKEALTDYECCVETGHFGPKEGAMESLKAAVHTSTTIPFSPVSKSSSVLVVPPVICCSLSFFTSGLLAEITAAEAFSRSCMPPGQP